MKKDDYKKIVLVAHSQGTIITGNVIADFNDIVDGTTKFNEEDRAALKNNMSDGGIYGCKCCSLRVWQACEPS